MNKNSLAIIAMVTLAIAVLVGVRSAVAKRQPAKAESAPVQQPLTVSTMQPPQIDPAWIAYTQTAVPEGGPMTGEECAAAGAAAGWSSTWGPASDGCWIISPDGRQIRHLGTWKE